jgi:cytochrome c peroxidase
MPIFLRRALSLLCLLAGCAESKNELPPARPVILAPEHYVDGQLVLGSPRLTAGIPGEGPLSIEQIRAWLDEPANHQPLDFVLPLGLRDAAPEVPADNPLTRARIELGRQLFFEKRLSGMGRSCSCAECHPPEMHFAFGNIFDPGRVRHARNAPAVFNRILSQEQFWDGRAESLEDQAMQPITNPIEMANTPEQCIATLKSIEGYRLQFERIFGGVSTTAIERALAAFQRALVSGPSPYDFQRELRRYELLAADQMTDRQRAEYDSVRLAAAAAPMSASALRGEALFFSDRTGCAECHRGPNLTDEQYHNLGVGMQAKDPDLGRFNVTGKESDKGAFKTPTLRNVAHTGPYMHDGALKDLSAVIEWFALGGQANPQLSPKVRPLELTFEEKRDLVEFLKSLTGDLPRVPRGRLPP